MRYLLVLLAISLFFAVTNPDTSDFIDWVVPHVMEANFRYEIERALGSVVAKPVLTSLTTRRDYAVASLFVVRASDSEHRFLGIAGQFIPLDKGTLDLQSVLP